MKLNYLNRIRLVLYCITITMTFRLNLSKINNFVFFFGISPYSFNRDSDKFECSIKTLAYTFVYFLCISITILYIALNYFVNDGKMFQTTFMILTLLQQSTVMFIFYAAMLDLIVKRKKHVGFLNNLIDLDSNLTILNINTNSDVLSTLHKQHFCIVFFYAAVYIINSTTNLDKMQSFEHVWNTMQFFQIMSLTMVGYYIRCFAIILHQRCKPIFERLNFIRRDMMLTNYKQERLAELMQCFGSFDEIMDLKNQLSNIYGVQLLLNSAFDFIMLTISVYGILYYQTQSAAVLYYFLAYNLPHAIKCVQLVLALDTLADQVSLLFYFTYF